MATGSSPVREFVLALDVPDTRPPIPIRGGQMAARKWIQHEDRPLESHTLTDVLVGFWDIAPTQINKESLCVTNTAAMTEHVFDIVRREVALGEPMPGMCRNGFEVTISHVRAPIHKNPQYLAAMYVHSVQNDQDCQQSANYSRCSTVALLTSADPACLPGRPRASIFTQR